MLTEISRGSHVYCMHVHYVSHNNGKTSQGWHLPITFMKYDRFYPRILGVNAQNTDSFSRILSVKLNEIAHYTENLYQRI